MWWRRYWLDGWLMRSLISSAVVIILLIVVVGLLIFLNQLARQEQERVQCLNTCKQILLASESFHDAMHHYPFDLLAVSKILPADLPWEKRHSWQFMIAPFLESRPDMGFHDASKVPWDSPEGKVYSQNEGYYFQCPSQQQKLDERGLGVGHYVGLTGLGLEAHLVPQGLST